MATINEELQLMKRLSLLPDISSLDAPLESLSKIRADETLEAIIKGGFVSVEGPEIIYSQIGLTGKEFAGERLPKLHYEVSRIDGFLVGHFVSAYIGGIDRSIGSFKETPTPKNLKLALDDLLATQRAVGRLADFKGFEYELVCDDYGISRAAWRDKVMLELVDRYAVLSEAVNGNLKVLLEGIEAIPPGERKRRLNDVSSLISYNEQKLVSGMGISLDSTLLEKYNEARDIRVVSNELPTDPISTPFKNETHYGRRMLHGAVEGLKVGAILPLAYVTLVGLGLLFGYKDSLDAVEQIASLSRDQVADASLYFLPRYFAALGILGSAIGAGAELKARYYNKKMLSYFNQLLGVDGERKIETIEGVRTEIKTRLLNYLAERERQFVGVEGQLVNTVLPGATKTCSRMQAFIDYASHLLAREGHLLEKRGICGMRNAAYRLMPSQQ